MYYTRSAEEKRKITNCPAAEARVRSRVSPCGICGEQSGTGTGFPLSISFHWCFITRRRTKIIIIVVIFITGLHKKPQGCGASVASAAGPFTTKKLSCRFCFWNFLFEKWKYDLKIHVEEITFHCMDWIVLAVLRM
jgi:hypothetical protein